MEDNIENLSRKVIDWKYIDVIAVLDVFKIALSFMETSIMIFIG